MLFRSLLLSEKLNGLPEEKMLGFIKMIRGYFKDLEFPVIANQLTPYLLADKKNTDSTIKCILLDGECNPKVDQVIKVDEVIDAIHLLSDALQEVNS